MTSLKIIPVVLSGGAGTRLWPLSRRLRPKQFLELTSSQSLFADTLERVQGDQFTDPVIICNEDHRFLVAEEFRQLGMAYRSIMLEPAARNTAPAIAAVATMIASENPDALMLVLPSDHVIGDVSAFHEAIDTAARVAANNSLVTFGIDPTGPETGYGYIQTDTALADLPNCSMISRFVEKPDVDTAADYLASGDYVWNSGMFLFSAGTYLAELERFFPEMVSTCKIAVATGNTDLTFFRLGAEAFAQCQAVSIDYAVMEKTDRAVVVRTEMGWSDVGAWSALGDLGSADETGNVRIGDVILHDAKNSYVRSERPLVAAIGVENLIIVATDDAVLVAPKDKAQDVRHIVDKLKADERYEHESHTRVYRPWGHYQNLEQGRGFLVKQIVVKPGAKLSLQYHHHRAEHWVVVEGEARVTNGDDVLTLTANQSTFIPVGARHRLENPSDTPLRLIEVQSGDYIGEDDIVRLEDDFERLK